MAIEPNIEDPAVQAELDHLLRRTSRMRRIIGVATIAAGIALGLLVSQMLDLSPLRDTNTPAKRKEKYIPSPMVRGCLLS
jgi:hypothetical protein